MCSDRENKETASHADVDEIRSNYQQSYYLFVIDFFKETLVVT